MNFVPQRFVYVEDSADQRELLALQFAENRHWNEILCLEGVRAFREYLSSPDTAPVDVLIVDWRLRDGSGADVISMARQHEKANGAAILAVSAVTEERQMAEADRIGGHYWLEKPLTVDLIKDALVAINGFGEVIVRMKK